MRRIRHFLCSEAVELKLETKHSISRAEIESVGAGSPVFLRHHDLHIMLGQTESGRYLFVLLRYLGHGVARIITAHEMTRKERGTFQKLGG